MTDRELLELAAKAAGWMPNNNWRWSERADAFRYCLGGDWIEWNPLTSDGDALRLAVKLGLDVEMHGCNSAHPYAAAFDCTLNIAEEVQPNDGDPYAATRRAITRAAAEIGKTMP